MSFGELNLCFSKTRFSACVRKWMQYSYIKNVTYGSSFVSSCHFVSVISIQFQNGLMSFGISPWCVWKDKSFGWTISHISVYPDCRKTATQRYLWRQKGIFVDGNRAATWSVFSSSGSLFESRQMQKTSSGRVDIRHLQKNKKGSNKIKFFSSSWE